jgi:hypothetical protein
MPYRPESTGDKVTTAKVSNCGHLRHQWEVREGGQGTTSIPNRLETQRRKMSDRRNEPWEKERKPSRERRLLPN